MRFADTILLERFLRLGSAALLGYWVVVAAQGCLSQATLSNRLDALRVHAGEPGSARLARREAHGSGLVGRIEIPRLKLSAIVVEGTSNARLRRGVGHLPGSAFPGERGNVVLAGHRDSWFRKLRGVEHGDRVILTTPDGVFRYRVDRTLVVPPQRTDLIASTRTSTLTLVTCHPFDWIGPAPDRFIVRSRPDRPGPGTPLASQARRGPRASSPASELPS